MRTQLQFEACRLAVQGLFVLVKTQLKLDLGYNSFASASMACTMTLATDNQGTRSKASAKPIFRTLALSILPEVYTDVQNRTSNRLWFLCVSTTRQKARAHSTLIHSQRKENARLFKWARHPVGRDYPLSFHRQCEPSTPRRKHSIDRTLGVVRGIFYRLFE